MSDRIAQLESTLLEIGTELFRLRREVAHLSESRKDYRNIFKSLKQLLDEKGVLSSDDFETAIDLNKILDNPADQNPDNPIARDLEKQRKIAH